MKKNIFLLAGLLALSTLALAGDKGNGGETVDVNGIPRLRDLVQNTTCSWLDGESMMARHPLLSQILTRLATVDWYYAADLTQEIKDLEYCLTGNLVRVDTRDIDSLVTTFDHRSFQVAIRLNNQVYLNERHMQQMPTHDQAFLIIHEAMHSYIPRDASMRNFKVRSQVRAIESVFKGDIATTRLFHLQLVNNSVTFPLTVEYLRPSKDAVLFLLGDYAARREILFRQNSVQALVKRIQSISVNDLASWHHEKLRGFEFADVVLAAVIREDIELLQFLLSAGTAIRNETIAILYSSEAAQSSPRVSALIRDVALVRQLVNNLFQDLASPTITQDEQGRLVVAAMTVLAARTPPDTAFTTLRALTNQLGQVLDPKTSLMVEFIKNMLRGNEAVLLDQVIFSNPLFYAGFGMGIKEQLRARPEVSALEKEIALRKVDTLLRGFWIMLKAEIIRDLGKEDWRAFASKVDVKQLGYAIE